MLKTRKEKVYLVLIGLFAAAIITVAVIGFVRRGANPVETPAPAPKPTAEVVVKEVEKLIRVEKEITAEILQDGLNDMGLLITEEYYFTEVVNFSSVKKFLKTDIELGFTESGYLASYDGVVTAGIDFRAVTVEKDDEAKIVTVHIPKAEIQNVDIDPNSFTLYSERVGLGNPLSAADFNSSLVELEDTASARAVERGLLTRADANAKALISNFISGLVDSSVYTVTYVRG